MKKKKIEIYKGWTVGGEKGERSDGKMKHR